MMWNYLGEFVVAAVAFGISYFIISLHFLHKKYMHLPGPPLESFISGNIPGVIAEVKKGGNFFRYLLHNAEKYGSTFRVMMMNVVFVVTSDAEAIKDLMITGNYKKPPMMSRQLGTVFGARLMGSSLITEPDHTSEKYAARRSVLNTFFQRSKIKNLSTEFNECIDTLMVRLTSLADGKKKVTLFDEFSNLSLDLIAQLGFGMSMNTVESGNNMFKDSIRSTLMGLTVKWRNPFIYINPFKWGFIWQTRKECLRLRKFGAKLIQERREALVRGEYIKEDILSHLIQLAVDNPSMTDEDIVDDFITFFIAGQETTSALLGYMVMCLGLCPRVLEKLRNEVDTTIGNKPTIDFNDLGKLPYMDMVMKETLRRHPPGPVTYREVNNDSVIDGYRIPAGSIVAFCMYAISNSKEIFENPEEFIPERFDANNEERVKTYTYFPFSLGHRSCLGKHFAEFQTKIVIAKFLQRFNFELDPDQPFDDEEAGTFRPRGKVICTLTLRDQENAD